MKILYGVQGTGNGHISRARMMARHFNQRGADVQYLFSGRAPEQLFDMEAFGDFAHRQGLSFASAGGKVSYFKTLLEAKLLRFYRDIRDLDLSAFDLVITDFEPVSAWAGRLQNKTVIGMGHQYAFGESTPVAGENFMARFIMRNFAPASTGIGLHWHNYDRRILPPIVDPVMQRNEAEPYILVYLPFEDQQAVTALLNRFPQHRFFLYSSDLEDNRVGNVEQRKACYAGFKRDLCGARAVFCNAGFELISECLHIGLPVLAKPLAGQMEQLSNAEALQMLGYARTAAELNVGAVGEWLQELAKAGESRAQRYPDVAGAIVDWILAGEWREPENLATDLWSQVQAA